MFIFKIIYRGYMCLILMFIRKYIKILSYFIKSSLGPFLLAMSPKYAYYELNYTHLVDLNFFKKLEMISILIYL